MGKTLSDYQKQYDRLDNDVTDLNTKYLSAARSIKGIEDMFPLAIEAIGDRVQALKNAGAAGSTLADFQQDADIRTQLGLLIGLTALGKQYKTALDLKKDAEALVAERLGLLKTLKAEIKPLEKTKDASLAAFKKLEKEVNELETSTTWGKSIDELTLVKKERYDQKAVEKSNLEKAAAAAAAAKAGPAQKKAMEYDDAKAVMQLQHASAQVDKAKKLKTHLEALCAEAVAARDPAKAKPLLAAAAKLREELLEWTQTNRKAVKESYADTSNLTVKKILLHFKSTEDVLKAAEAVLAQAVRSALRPSTPTA